MADSPSNVGMAEHGMYPTNLFPISRNIMRKLITALILLIHIVAPASAAYAQSTEDWTSPVNLSRSGAASQPRIVAAADGKLQAFWWDRFDGLMSAVTTVDQSNPEPVWSDPFPAPISSKYLEETPFLIADATGWVHALWLEPVKDTTGAEEGAGSSSAKTNSLMHSQTRFGEALWTFPEILAESAVAFEVTSPPSGGITVAYIRTEHTPDFPAGVYVKHDYGFEDGWGFSTLVYPSIYYRLLSPDQAQIRLADSGEAPSEDKHTLYLSWFDPHQEAIEFSMS